MSEFATSPFPITEEAVEEFRTVLLNGPMKEISEKLEKVKAKLMAEYEEHVENMLKDVPPFARFYGNNFLIKFRGREYHFETKHPLPVLPEDAGYSLRCNVNKVYLNSLFNLFYEDVKEMVELQTFMDDNARLSVIRSASKNAWWSIDEVYPPYRPIINDLIEGYVERTKKEIAELITGTAPVEEKPAVQLGLFEF